MIPETRTKSFGEARRRLGARTETDTAELLGLTGAVLAYFEYYRNIESAVDSTLDDART
jgi:hypothetical protein